MSGKGVRDLESLWNLGKRVVTAKDPIQAVLDADKEEREKKESKTAACASPKAESKWCDKLEGCSYEAGHTGPCFKAG
jgi:hypothetical protein